MFCVQGHPTQQRRATTAISTLGEQITIESPDLYNGTYDPFSDERLPERGVDAYSLPGSRGSPRGG